MEQPAGALRRGGAEARAAAPWAAALNSTTEMRVHLGDRGTATMRFSESRHAFSLDLVLVPASCRGEGLGTALLQRLFAIADSLAKPVHTTARPIGTSSPEVLRRLVRYYERLGFVTVEEGFSCVHMKRPSPSRSPGR